MSDIAGQKRCVCGHSSSYPICDETHVGTDWSCKRDTGPHLEWIFVASASLQNLALRLAHQFEGLAVWERGEALRCERLVVITDGHRLSQLQSVMAAVDARQTTVLGVGMAGEAVRWAFPGLPWVTIPDDSMTTLWHDARRALEAPRASQPQLPPTVFVSHAVADEPEILPVLEVLTERYGVELFICSHIKSGKRWHKEILDHLHEYERFVFLNSAAASASTFCAFECGVALSTSKSVHVIGLDDANPPAYLQHLQMASVPRRVAVRPWLTTRDVLLELLLEALTEAPASSAVTRPG